MKDEGNSDDYEYLGHNDNKNSFNVNLLKGKVKIKGGHWIFLFIGISFGILIFWYFFSDIIKKEGQREGQTQVLNNTINFGLGKAESDLIENQRLQSLCLANNEKDKLTLLKKEAEHIQDELNRLTAFKLKLARFDELEGREKDKLLSEMTTELYKDDPLPRKVNFGFFDSEQVKREYKDSLRYERKQVAVWESRYDSLNNVLGNLKIAYSNLNKQLVNQKSISSNQLVQLTELKRQIERSEQEMASIKGTDPPDIDLGSSAQDANQNFSDSLIKRFLPRIDKRHFYVFGIPKKGGYYNLNKLKNVKSQRNRNVKFDFTLIGELDILQEHQAPRLKVVLHHKRKNQAGTIEDHVDDPQFPEFELGKEINVSFDLDQGIYVGDCYVEVWYQADKNSPFVYIGRDSFMIKKALEKRE